MPATPTVPLSPHEPRRLPGAPTVGVLALTSVILAVSPGSTAAQTATDSYFRAAASHFDIPVEEVMILSEWRIPPEEVPVALELARHAGVSTDALVTQRRSGSWNALARRHGVGLRPFYVALPPAADQGPLGQARDAFQSTPRDAWDTLSLSDAQIVALVNVAFLSDFLGVPVETVVEEARGATSFVEVYARLLESRGG